ncbi:flagellar hook-length control protein FliK [Jannaschia sp. 2305UL9-9]|uniref:flagellar hook-length control protein FliK n=1 Tax=Jannaschia sp. 2305UL9-9 TaxID=3121638 RepID=UPI00352971E2
MAGDTTVEPPSPIPMQAVTGASNSPPATLVLPSHDAMGAVASAQTAFSMDGSEGRIDAGAAAASSTPSTPPFRRQSPSASSPQDSLVTSDRAAPTVTASVDASAGAARQSVRGIENVADKVASSAPTSTWAAPGLTEAAAIAGTKAAQVGHAETGRHPLSPGVQPSMHIPSRSLLTIEQPKSAHAAPEAEAFNTSATRTAANPATDMVEQAPVAGTVDRPRPEGVFDASAGGSPDVAAPTIRTPNPLPTAPSARQSPLDSQTTMKVRANPIEASAAPSGPSTMPGSVFADAASSWNASGGSAADSAASHPSPQSAIVGVPPDVSRHSPANSRSIASGATDIPAATPDVPMTHREGEPTVQAAVGTVSDSGSRDIIRPPISASPVPVPELEAVLRDRIQSLARQIANNDAQVAGQRSAPGEAKTEIELSPPELGRLKMVLQSGDKGLHVQITAERPETLDLIRRHVEGFHRSLQSEGVTLNSVDISSDGGPSGHETRGEYRPDGLISDGTDAEKPDETPIRPVSDGTRLDIRF